MSAASYSVEIDRITEQEWSDLVPCFHDATLHQTWSAGRLQIGETNLSHLTVKQGPDVVAMAQVMIRKLPLDAAGIATVYWGPLWRRKNRRADPAVLSRTITALRDEYAVARRFLLRLWPAEYSGAEHAKCLSDVLRDCGFVLNQRVEPFRTILIDLTPPEEVLRKNLDHKWRNQLSAAERANLSLVDGTSDAMYTAFLSMLRDLVARKKFSSHVDYDRYGRLQSNLPPALKMRILVCEHEGIPVAAGVFSGIGSTGAYLLGATAANGLKLNGSNLIQWSVLKWLKGRGCEWYDLGGIDPAGNPGVYRFKKGIAGKAGREAVHVGQYYIAHTHAARVLNGCLRRAEDAKRFAQRIHRLLGAGRIDRAQAPK